MTDEEMNNKFTESFLKNVSRRANLALILIAGVAITYQLIAFDVVKHTIMCACILLLVTCILICDGILKDYRRMKMHIIWYALWFFNLIVNLLKI